MIKHAATAAVRMLKQHSATFSEHYYIYKEKGGAAQGACELGVAPHSVIKTLIMEDVHGSPLIVLMHGDWQVSTKALARVLEVKSVTPCNPKVADKHSGYRVGGTSPFGTRKTMPVYMERSILELPYIYVNGGRRGYLLGMVPVEIQRILQPTLVRVGIHV